MHSALGDLLRQLERYDAAVAAYDRALGAFERPDPAQWFLYYARGISKERLDDWPAAEADFREALELNPDQPQVLNYLGYSLVEHQQNLDEALAMIERAVAAQPQAGYIVDSLGWALYRLGRYDEAVGHMERAAELMAVKASQIRPLFPRTLQSDSDSPLASNRQQKHVLATHNHFHVRHLLHHSGAKSQHKGSPQPQL